MTQDQNNATTGTQSAPSPAQSAPTPAAPATGEERPARPSRPMGGTGGYARRPAYGAGQGQQGAGGSASGGPPRRGRFIPRRKVCAFCVEHATSIDYKNVQMLRRYMSDRAKIEPRRKTGTCAKHQRLLATALRRARHIALLPFTADQAREMIKHSA